MIYKNNKIAGIYKGNTNIIRAYKGNDLIYDSKIILTVTVKYYQYTVNGVTYYKMREAPVLSTGGRHVSAAIYYRYEKAGSSRNGGFSVHPGSFSFIVEGSDNYRDWDTSKTLKQVSCPDSNIEVVIDEQITNITNSWAPPELAPNGVYFCYFNPNTEEVMLYSSRVASGVEAMGAALITDNCRICIGLDEIYRVRYLNNTSLTTAINNGLRVSTQQAQAITDYNGKQNTECILRSYPSQASVGNEEDPGIELLSSSTGANTSHSAAWYCNNYVFPDGQNGYLPAAGELNGIIQNMSRLNTILSGIGGTTLNYSITLGNATGFWCSTAYNASAAWYALPAGTFAYTSIQNGTTSSPGLVARPICSLVN